MRHFNFRQLFVAMAALLCGIAVSAQVFEVDGFQYEISGDEVTLKRISHRSETKIVIPNTVTYDEKTYSVTSIGSGAFNQNWHFTNIEIPNSVTSIEDYAFQGCGNLANIEIPNSVTSIGNLAFSYCHNIESIKVEDGNKVYDSRDNCNAIVKTATNTLIAGCKNTTFPNSVTSIGFGAFIRYNLTVIEIPNNITKIENYAITDCNIENIKVKDGNKVYDSRDNCNAIIETATNTLIAGFKNTTIPNSVTSIGIGAFENCRNLANIEIPNSVTSIGDYAFRSCRNLANIEIPNSVTSIGDYAFEFCENLTSIVIPNSVTSIGNAAFEGCVNLANIEIPNSVTSIGEDAFRGTKYIENIENQSGIVYLGSILYDYNGSMPYNTTIKVKDGTTTIASHAFNGCSNLTNIEIPNSVTSIEKGAFIGCSGLTSVSIPNSVTNIGDNAFYNCSNLTSIEIPNSVTSIGGEAFHGTSWFNNQPAGIIYIGNILYTYNGTMLDNTSIKVKDGTTMIVSQAFAGCSNLTNIEIPNSVISIGKEAFAICNNLTSIEIPNSVTSIENGAFHGCGNLTNIEIPNSVTSIGDYAFQGCGNLANIEIPNSVTSIGIGAFEGCTALNEVTSNAKVAPSCYTNTFINISPTANLNYPKNSDYSAWEKYFATTTPIAEIIAEGECSDNIKWTINSDGISIIRGKGTMQTMVGLFGGYQDSVKAVIIEDGITSIGSYAFYECKNLTCIEIPNSVTYIGYYAFNGCYNLKEVYIDNLSSWCRIKFNQEDNPLYYAKNLYIKGILTTETTIPNDITELKNWTFGNANISQLNLHENITAIGKNAIPSSTTKLRLNSKTPPTIEYFNESAQEPLNNVEIVFIPKGCMAAYREKYPWSSKILIEGDGNTVSITTTPGLMGEEILKQANYLHEVNHLIIKGSINNTDIDNIKNSMPNLITINMSGVDMESIPDEMFKDRKGLLSITLPNSVTSIGYDAFLNCVNLDNIVLPEGLTTINSSYSKYGTSSGCFCNCNSLKTITFPSTIRVIGSGAFYSCSNLMEINFNNGTKNLNIDEAAFLNCYNLTKINFNEDVEQLNIGDMAFSGSSIRSISIPAGLRSIGGGAFYCCSKLENVILGEGVTSIGYKHESSNDSYYDDKYYGAFESCSSLKKVALPNSLVNICQNTFRNCSSLESIEIPEGVEFIGKNAFGNCYNFKKLTLPSSLQQCSNMPFAGCSKLDTVICMALLAPNLVDGLLTLKDMGLPLKRILYVPEWTLAKYKLSSGWAAFSEILPIKNIYPESINVVGDHILSLPETIPDGYKPNIKMSNYGTYGENPSSLNLRGKGKLCLNNFVSLDNGHMGDTYWGQLLNEEAHIEANNIFLDIYLTNYNNNTGNNNQKWYFFSFPFDVKVSDIATNCNWVIRRYDGAARADFDYNNTWVSIPYDGVLEAGQGYIWACTGGTFNISAVDNDKKNNIFTTETVKIPLKEHLSDLASDNSWNLIGNPFPCYYDTREMDFTAPITVWNNENSTYSAYSPVDDNYVLSPFEAFFVQKPASVENIAFSPEGRQLSSSATTKNNIRRALPKVYSAASKRTVINLELSNEKYTDKTRFVINENAEMDYEMNCDAAKFMSTDADVPQLYTMVNDEKFAINERPMSDGIVKLGTYFGKAGNYSLSMQGASDIKVVLVDLKTGVETDITDGSYTFDAEVTDKERFVVKLYDGDVTGIEIVADDAKVTATADGIAVTASKDVNIAIYNAAGSLVAEGCSRAENFVVIPGVYIVKINGVAHRVVVSK